MNGVTNLGKIDPHPAGEAYYHVVIETPKGSQNKYKYEVEAGYFILHKVLPMGAVFPYDFGFIPGTKGEDGDPLDVLILMDQSTFTGCVVRVWLIGVIEAEQTEKNGDKARNDRLIGVAVESHQYRDLKSAKDLDPHLLEEVEHFFISYDEIEGKRFEPLGVGGPNRAEKLVEVGIESAKDPNKK